MSNLIIHRERLFFQKRDVSKTSVDSVIKQLKNADISPSMVVPDMGALLFYMLNHVWADLSLQGKPYQPMSADVEKFVESFFETMNIEAIRMFYYMLLICTRESRHVFRSSVFDEKLTKKFGADAIIWLDKIKGYGSTDAVEKFKNSSHPYNLGWFVDMMVWVFNKGGFGSSFGGKKWGNVAKVLRDFVHGEISAEVFMDCGFNLAHNGGPIFNKGMYYEMYTGGFIKILDVQRSGQIPVYIKECGQAKSALLLGLYTLSLKVSPHLFEGHVDWKLVAKDGVGSYTAEQTEQYKKYGKPEHMLKAEAEVASKTKKAAEKAKKKMEEHEFQLALKKAKEFSVYGDTYEVTKRVAK